MRPLSHSVQQCSDAGPAKTLLADVAAVVHTLEADMRDALVSGVDGAFAVRSRGGDAQDPAARGFQAAVEMARAGVEDGSAGAIGHGYPFDLFAGLIRSRVSGAGDDDAHAGAGLPFEAVPGEAAFGRRQERGQEV